MCYIKKTALVLSTMYFILTIIFQRKVFLFDDVCNEIKKIENVYFVNINRVP